MNERLSANPNRAGAINNDRMLRRVWHEYLSVLSLYSSLFERKSPLTKLHVPDYNETSRNAPWNTWIRSEYDAFFRILRVYIPAPRVESTASTHSGLAPRRLDFLKKLSRIQRRCTYVITDNSLQLARNIRDATCGLR